MSSAILPRPFPLPTRARMISPTPLRRPDPRVSPVRRKPVSIAIGFPYDQGIVFCADTKITTSIKTNESKIAFFVSSDGQCCMTFAMCGSDLTFPRSAVTPCWEVVKKMDFSTATMDAVHNTAEFSLGEFYRDHIFPHPDRTPGAVYFELLVGIWLKGETRLFVLHETLLTPVDTYECIGSGAYLANYLIRQYRRANPGPMTLEDAALISSFCVDAAIDYDETCGGENETLIVRNDGDVSNAYDTVLYPNMMVGDLQQETWKLLHGLAHVKTKAEIAAELEKHFEGVRQLNRTFAGNRRIAG